MSFEQLGLLPTIQKALVKEGYTTPTPIQEQAIPLILQKRDVCGIAQTGTGKTAAFALPILHHLQSKPASQPRQIRALILTPTRELAIQIKESFMSYGRFTDIRSLVIFGGVGQKPQTDALQKGVDVLIATPGRLLDLKQQGFINLNHLEIFVLDEADRMLDMGFIHDIKKVVASLPHERQSLFFSATMPGEIQNLANTILKQPVRVEVTPVSSTGDTIKQSVFHVAKANKLPLLIHLLEDRNFATVLVFTRTKHGADKVAKALNKEGIGAEAIHGNKSQNTRQRALQNFKNWKTRVLVATDIAARGIDIEQLSHVINFDIPNEPETYVHRIGRTGRAGARGVAIAFCDFDEAEYMRDIHKLIGKKVPVDEVHPFAIEIPDHILQPRVIKPKFQGPRGHHSGDEKRFGGPKGKFAPRDGERGRYPAKPGGARKPSSKPAGKVYAPDYAPQRSANGAPNPWGNSHTGPAPRPARPSGPRNDSRPSTGGGQKNPGWGPRRGGSSSAR